MLISHHYDDNSSTGLKAPWFSCHINKLTSLPAEIFKDLNRLVELHLEHNLLISLRVGIFDNLNALLWLCLGYNQLTNLPAGIFNTLSALKVLRLNNNQLTSLPAGIFNDLSALQELPLYDNPLPYNITTQIERQVRRECDVTLPHNDEILSSCVIA